MTPIFLFSNKDDIWFLTFSLKHHALISCNYSKAVLNLLYEKSYCN